MAHHHNLLRAYYKAREESTAHSAAVAYINDPPPAINSPASHMNSQEFNLALGGDNNFDAIPSASADAPTRGLKDDDDYNDNGNASRVLNPKPNITKAKRGAAFRSEEYLMLARAYMQEITDATILVPINPLPPFGKKLTLHTTNTNTVIVPTPSTKLSPGSRNSLNEKVIPFLIVGLAAFKRQLVSLPPSVRRILQRQGRRKMMLAWVCTTQKCVSSIANVPSRAVPCQTSSRK